MNKYDSYKDTKIPWIGNIPNHWGLSLVGRHFEIGRGRVISKIEIEENKGDYPVYSSQTSNNGELGKINTYDFDGEYVTWTTDGVHTGTCFYRTGKFNTTNVCGMLSLKKTLYSLPFLSYYLNRVTKPYVRVDINPKLMNNMMSEIPLVIPPLSEQQQIVEFLDTKTGLIDSLIEKTERKRELLKEKRTSLINETVTKGLNPNVEMKDSGVEWIGEIPSHWYLNKVGHNTYVKGRIGWKGLRSEDFKEVGPYLITGTDFNKDGTINWENMYHVEQWRYDEDPFIQLQDHDVLITKDGTIGKVVYVGNLKGQTCLNSGIFLTRPTNNEYKSRFFFWLLNSNVFKVFVDYNSGGSTIQHLYQNVFVKFKFPIPPIIEQQQIIEYLDEQTGLIDKTISNEEKRIELLKEYRQSLISEVVTGKRKVTN